MAILVRKPGIFTTVQDLGHPGFRRFGVNPGGAMDRTAVQLINTLLGNSEDAAVLEMHFPAAEILFESEVTFALGGANFAAELNGTSVSNWRCIRARSGDTLRFTGIVKGTRTYLGCGGGFVNKKTLGEATKRLEGETRLGLNMSDASRTYVAEKIANSILPRYSRFPTVRVIEGPESDSLTAKSEAALFHEQFTATKDSDRMGYRLEGEPLYRMNEGEMVSAGVTFGTVQLLPSGQMIVLMADHQTSGGYPRIAQVISQDLPLLAQLGPGDKVAFHRVEITEAERIALRFESDLALLRTAVSLRS